MTTTADGLSVVTPADWISPSKQGHWTYADYVSLPNDGNRYEIVNGVLFMAPSPSGAHQDAVFRIALFLFNHVEAAGLGKMRIAPFNVRFSPADVFQPDVLIVLNANRGKIKDTYILGAPDLVVEVASPRTAGFDRREKQDVYAHFGVPEYWIADADARTVEVLVLEDGKYRSLGVFRGQETPLSRVMPEIAVYVEQFFA